MKIVDIRGILPFDSSNYAGRWIPKISTTVHWPGTPVAPTMSDDDAIEMVKRFAQGHIDRDWSALAGQQGGASLMYHEVIAPSGTLFLTRDPADIVWHAESLNMFMDGQPNHTSHALMVLTDPRGPTLEQVRTLRAVLPQRPNPVYGNREWMSTQCPGDALMALIREYRATGTISLGEEDTMTPAQEAKLDRALALLDKLASDEVRTEPRVWTARLQRGVDVERTDAFDPNRPALDPRVKQ